MFLSRFMPCTECGGSVERLTELEHQCDPTRLVDFHMFELRYGVADFEPHLHSFLESTGGRFEVWLAARDVAASGSDG